MKKNNGFSIVVVLVAIAAIAAIIASGYVVYKESQKNDDKSSTTSNSSDNASSSKSSTNASKPNYTIRYVNSSNHDAGIIYYTAADLAKLPADFPAGAKAYMQNNIGKLIDPNDSGSCVQVYSIKNYNDVNVGGGDFSVDANKEGCPGGAAAILSLDATNSWRLTGFQAVPQCDVVIAAKIYKDFLAQCYADKNGNNDFSDDELIDNPNGNSTAL